MTELPIFSTTKTPAAPETRTPPTYLTTQAEVRYGDGFSYEERDETHTFRWMGQEGTLTFEPKPEIRHLEVWVLSEFKDLSQELRVEWLGTDRETPSLPLLPGWGQLSLDVPAGSTGARLAVNKPFPAAYYPDDERQLAIRVGTPRLHADPERHERVALQHENGILNLREMIDGETVLRSYPQSLGIDMYGVCNVKPPCVYCEWDYNKELEGENVEAPFTTETLDEWGEFFDSPSFLVNCSIGEPFMMKEVDDLLDRFGDYGKVLELTTNGQILTDRNIKKLLGRNIHLYISLDAATPETYAKLRNDKFERILVNLQRLIEAKGGKGQLPLVYLVFMPMQVNLHEAEAFVELCAEIGVDRLVLRPLNYAEQSDLNWERGGYSFRYEDEQLTMDQAVRVSGRVAALCQRYGVELSDQMDFGGSMSELFRDGFEEGRREVDSAGTEPLQDKDAAASEAAAEIETVTAKEETSQASPSEEPLPPLGDDKLPICQEPWKSLYILRRGVFPCCYGGAAIATMDQYREVWNSETMQGLRRELRAGRFHEYCLRSPSCPIVRKTEAGTGLETQDGLFLRALRLWQRIDRAGGGLPGKVLGPLKPTGRRLLKRLLGSSSDQRVGQPAKS